uniref:Ribonuclease A-domain domain-containing protein n=1 Tax=Mola mola TaxID=94237 RepID=A0A3Q3XEQ5_MOLML
MAPLKAFFILSVGLLLAHQTFARNDAPCQPSDWNKGYNTFVQHHIPSGTPNSLNQTEWKNFIQTKTGCSRPTQSFLSPKDLDKVREVCSSKGGKTHKENLCISRQSFTFVTVRSEPGTCGIKSIREENKHLILACEVLGNDCLPVHFEGNPKNLKPNGTAVFSLAPPKRV